MIFIIICVVLVFGIMLVFWRKPNFDRNCIHSGQLFDECEYWWDDAIPGECPCSSYKEEYR